MPAIGIDLGTTSARVAVWKNGVVHVIDNEHGRCSTPCYVAFTNDESQIGEEAENQVHLNAANTVYNIKRLLGRKSDDPKISNDDEKSSYKISSDDNKNIVIDLRCQGEPKRFRTEEIISMILYKMKIIAEKFLNDKVTDAVISVPAFFGDVQRQATLDAGKIAGLNVLRLINEPTAAALAYGVDTNGYKKSQETLLVFHLGGGSFSVSIIKIMNGTSYQVVAVAGDENLGGVTFDNRLMDYVLKELANKIGGRPLPGSDLIRLRKACEVLKINLSFKMEDTLEINSLLPENITNISVKMTRERFEKMTIDLISKINDCVQTVLQEAILTAIQIDDVIMVGGSTQMPKIRSFLAREFNAHNLKGLRDDAVVRGAAIHAAALTDIYSFQVKNITVSDIISKSLGTPIQCGLLMNIISKNSKLPNESSMDLSTVGNETQLSVLIYEGEDDFSNKTTIIRECNLNLSPNHTITRKLQVKLVVNVNGICELSAIENWQSGAKQLHVSALQQNLSDSDIKRMKNEAMAFRRHEENLRRSRLARSTYSDYIIRWKQVIGDENSKSSYNDPCIIKLQKELDAEWKWLESNSNMDADILERRLKTFQALCESTLQVMENNLPSWLTNLFSIKRK